MSTEPWEQRDVSPCSTRDSRVVDLHDIGGDLAEYHVEAEHHPQLEEAARGVALVRLQPRDGVRAAVHVPGVRVEPVLGEKSES